MKSENSWKQFSYLLSFVSVPQLYSAAYTYYSTTGGQEGTSFETQYFPAKQLGGRTDIHRRPLMARAQGPDASVPPCPEVGSQDGLGRGLNRVLWLR